MEIIARVIKSLGIAVCISIAMPAFADPAPVYDADAIQQDDNIGVADQSQDLPPPPPPGQEGAFVPNQAVPPSVAPPQSSSSLSMEQRIRRMEQQVNNMQNNDMAVRMDSLQDQVQTLRNQVEQLTHQLQQAQAQQKNMFTDLDKRLSQQTANAGQPASMAAANNVSTNSSAEAATAEEAATIAAASPVTARPAHKAAKSKIAAVSEKPTPKITDGQPDVAEEQQIYQTAYNFIKAKKYNEAVTALQGMLKKYPSGQFASNAHYWLGELYGLMGKNDQALTEFSAVVKTFPDSPRVSDAQLKVGLIYASQTKWSEAKAAFKKVIIQYPGTASARLASEQLKQLKLAGH
jgi:tol-pal system protein YbgF